MSFDPYDPPPIEAAGDVVWSGLQGGNHLGPTCLPVRFVQEGRRR